MSNKTIFKLYLFPESEAEDSDPDVRKIALDPEFTYPIFIDKIRDVFNLDKSEVISIQYRDQENDKINVCSTEELKNALTDLVGFLRFRKSCILKSN